MKKINLKDMMKRICLCSIINVSLVLFILIISFYLIRRVNKIKQKNRVESFNTDSLENIDGKIDFINGFKNVKTGKKKKDKTSEVPRSLYPDKNDTFRFYKKT